MSEIISILALIVSALGLGLSFYVTSRNKPKLIIEKDTLEIKKGINEIWIRFYLSNIGERTAPIKDIIFYNPETNYIPNVTFLREIDSTTTLCGFNIVRETEYQSLDFPGGVSPHSTMKILAKLNFAKNESEIKRNNFSYVLTIKCPDKDIKKTI